MKWNVQNLLGHTHTVILIVFCSKFSVSWPNIQLAWARMSVRWWNDERTIEMLERHGLGCDEPQKWRHYVQELGRKSQPSHGFLRSPQTILLYVATQNFSGKEVSFVITNSLIFFKKSGSHFEAFHFDVSVIADGDMSKKSYPRGWWRNGRFHDDRTKFGRDKLVGSSKLHFQRNSCEFASFLRPKCATDFFFVRAINIDWKILISLSTLFQCISSNYYNEIFQISVFFPKLLPKEG